ncbi:MAG TPA: glycosyl hydrolase family 28 protein [Tichowtungia sp.]|nr:glycosyl hydrolase family 28 protein [Tichowtungia sp.]
MRRYIFLLFVIMGLTSAAAQDTEKVITYSFPPEMPLSGQYDANINGSAVPVLKTEKGSILSFGMRGPVTITVLLDKAPENVVVRPVHAGIKATLSGRQCTFHLDRPRNLSVEFDGDLDHPLLVFANPELNNPPDKEDPKVHYFEAGKVHEAGELFLQDGETLYLEGGAVVHGLVRAVGANNVSIRGAGILDASPRKHKINMLVFRECTNVSLENFILLNPRGWSIHLSGSEDIDMSNVRVIGWRANSDGLDIEYCRNIHVTKCFWRTKDDCIAVKALYPPGITGVPLEEMINPETLGKHEVPRYENDTIGNILITDCVLWNERPGNAFEIGFELRVDRIRNVTLRNCDIIHVVNGAAFSIHNGDRAVIENVLLDDIRVEDTDELIDIVVGLSIYSDDCPGPYRRSNPDRIRLPMKNRPGDNTSQWVIPEEEDRARFAEHRGRVKGVVVRDMSVLSPPRSPSIISGYDARHSVSDVTFERLTIEGKPIRSAAEAQIELHHAENIRFINQTVSE